jgi:hypothetical protein
MKMTAIGLALAVIGFGGGMLTQDSYSIRTQAIHDCFGVTLLIGLLLVVAGSVIKLWEIMP